MTQTSDSLDGVHAPEKSGVESLIATVQRNWALEMDGAAMYAGLADRDKIPERKVIFQKLSDLERKHADQWSKRLRELGGSVPTSYAAGAHGSEIATTPGGMQEKLRAIEAEERHDVSSYLKQLNEIKDEPT
ncbi:MAG: hypothetical protein LC772_01160, partial [Chloroflexi bacterium]|nr:hypothetical protein [Chloroflexota bacterium]